MPSSPDVRYRAKLVLVDMPGYGFAYAQEGRREDWKGLVSCRLLTFYQQERAWTGNRFGRRPHNC